MRRVWKMTYAVDRSGHRSTFLPARFNVCKQILNQLINR